MRRRLEGYRQTLMDGLSFYRRMLDEPAFPGENTESLRQAVDAATRELEENVLEAGANDSARRDASARAAAAPSVAG